MRRAARCLLLFALCSMAALPALAQQRPPRPPAAAPAPPPEPKPPVYEPLMLHLSEVMGALSVMSEICRRPGDTGPVGEEWRSRMALLIEAEAQTQGMRDRLAGAYNRGALTYRTTYRVCTPAGRLALERLLGEGARIAAEISGRFGS